MLKNGIMKYMKIVLRRGKKYIKMEPKAHTHQQPPYRSL